MNEREARAVEISDRIRLNEHELQKLRDMQTSINEAHPGLVCVLNLIAEKQRAVELQLPSALDKSEFERGRLRGKLDALNDLAGLRSQIAAKIESVASQITNDHKAVQALRR